MRKWEANAWEPDYGWAPMTFGTGTHVDIAIVGPDRELDMRIEIEAYGQNVCEFVPVVVLANHLRLAGWTVTPPEAWKDKEDACRK